LPVALRPASGDSTKFCRGLVPERSYMVRGQAGSGKTILSFHFLQQGVDEGRRCSSSTSRRISAT